MAIHVGDIGTVFQLTLTRDGSTFDLSAATTKTLTFRSPSGALAVHAASFLTTGTDGILTYTTVDGDLNMSGDWAFQARVVLASGTWSSDFVTFTVKENL